MRLTNTRRSWHFGTFLILLAHSDAPACVNAAVGGPAPTHVYWVENSWNFGGARLRRMPVGGGEAEDLLLDDNLFVGDMQIDSSAFKIYWTAAEGGLMKVQRRNLDGSGAEDLYTHDENPDHFIDNVQLDLAAGKMYWTETDIPTRTYLIRRANLNGTGIENLLQTVGRPIELVLDFPRSQMIWQETIPFNGNESLHRANLDGSAHQTLANPYGLFNMDIDSVNQRLYTSYFGGDWIMRSGLSGNPWTIIYDQSSGVDKGPLDLELDPQGQYLYWVNELGGSVQRARVSPFSFGVSTLITGLRNPTVIALGVIPEPGTAGLVLVALAWTALRARVRR